MSRTWLWGLPMVAAVLVATGLFWESAMQPPVASAMALRQLEVHRDGTDDRLAAEGRLWWLVQHMPSGAATLTAVVLMAVWIRGTLAETRPAVHSNWKTCKQ